MIRSAPLEDIKQALRYAMMKIGLRSQNWPSEAEKAVLIDHILREYGGHTCAEIRLAFDMALAGKLDVEANCYENFSCLYFSNILLAYRSWAKEEVKQIPQPIQEPDAPKEDLSDVAMKDWMEDVRAKIKANQMMIDFAPLLLYDWAEKKGLLKLSNTEKHEYLRRAADYRLMLLANDANLNSNSTAQQNLREFSAMREAGEIKGKEIDIVKNLAKRIALYEYLKHG